MPTEYDTSGKCFQCGDSHSLDWMDRVNVGGLRGWRCQRPYVQWLTETKEQYEERQRAFDRKHSPVESLSLVSNDRRQRWHQQRHRLPGRAFRPADHVALDSGPRGEDHE